MKEIHGEKGHFNIHVRDHDSAVTGFGKHDRVVCFHPQFEPYFNCVIMYCRVDHKWNLGIPTIEHILKVSRKDQDIKGKFELVGSDSDEKSTDYYFKMV